jgi:hypothetical protein
MQNSSRHSNATPGRPEILPLRRHTFRRDHRAMDVIPTRVLEPLDRELFELVSGDHALKNLK